MATLVFEGPLDIVVPAGSWGTLGPEEVRVTEGTRAQWAQGWTVLLETRDCKGHKVCLASAKTAETALMASLGFPVIPAFPVLLGLRGLQGSVTLLPAKEPY